MSTLLDDFVGQICVAPPDEAITFRPTAYSGVYGHVLAYYPTYAFNLGDFSFEFWFRWGIGNASITSDVFTHFGISDAVIADFLYAGGATDWARLQLAGFTHDINEVRIRAGGGAWNQGTGAGFAAIPPGWCHIAVTFDRNGNMLTYLNGALVDTTNIAAGAAQSLGTCYVIGPGGEQWSTLAMPTGNWYDQFPVGNFFADWTGWTQARGYFGPWAVHNRILTPAEVSEAYNEQRCQNLGAAVTIIYIDPKNVEGVTAWDHDPSHVITGIRAASMGGLTLGIPRGAATTCTLQDSSGNGRHITLPTRAAYADAYGPLNGATNVHGWVAFMADPFWR